MHRAQACSHPTRQTPPCPLTKCPGPLERPAAVRRANCHQTRDQQRTEPQRRKSAAHPLSEGDFRHRDPGGRRRRRPADGDEPAVIGAVAEVAAAVARVPHVAHARPVSAAGRARPGFRRSRGFWCRPKIGRSVGAGAARLPSVDPRPPTHPSAASRRFHIRVTAPRRAPRILLRILRTPPTRPPALAPARLTRGAAPRRGGRSLRGDLGSADGGSPILPFPPAAGPGPHDPAGAGAGGRGRTARFAPIVGRCSPAGYYGPRGYSLGPTNYTGCVAWR
jgi:hypothetical protein